MPIEEEHPRTSSAGESEHGPKHDGAVAAEDQRERRSVEFVPDRFRLRPGERNDLGRVVDAGDGIAYGGVRRRSELQVSGCMKPAADVEPVQRIGQLLDTSWEQAQYGWCIDDRDHRSPGRSFGRRATDTVVTIEGDRPWWPIAGKPLAITLWTWDYFRNATQRYVFCMSSRGAFIFMVHLHTQGVGRPRDPKLDIKITQAAIKLFRERGWGRTTIEEIALRAGVGKTTVYRRYPTKAALALDAWKGD